MGRFDRQRGGTFFVEKWTNSKAAFIGFLTGRGYSSEAIAETLADGTDDATIRTAWANWRLKGDDGVHLTIHLAVRERSNLQDRAMQHGLPVEEYCRRLLVHGSMPRDRYDEITGGSI